MKKTAQQLLLLFLLSLAVSQVKSVKAQDTQSFTISPPSLKFELNPGEKIEKSIKVTNNTDTAVIFFANIQDFIVTDKQGTPELLPRDSDLDNRFAASAWSTVYPEMVSIAAGKTEIVTLFLQVPIDARPGGRYISVAFMPKTSGLAEGTGASVNSVAASLVYLTVNGDIEESARVTSFKAPAFSEYGPIDFETEIQNSGDLHITPKATIQVKNIFGKEVFSTALSSTVNVFPGTSRIYENSWQKKWLFGRYQADLTGLYGKEENLNLTAMTSFWVIPYKLILIVIVIIVLTLVLVNKIKNSPKEIKENQEITQDPPMPPTTEEKK